MKRTASLKNYGIVFIIGTTLAFLSLKTTVKPVPLLPRTLLFGNDQMRCVSISPCGTKIAFVARLDANDEMSPLTIWIQKLKSLKRKPILTSLTRSTWRYYWTTDGSKILYLQDTNGNENWQLYGIDIKTKKITCYTPFDDCQARIIELESNIPSTIALALNKRNPSIHDLYTLNVQTGALTLLCINPGAISHWTLDKELRVRAALRETSDGGKELLATTYTTNPQWEAIRTYSPDDNQNGCSIIAYSARKDCLYLLESKEYNTLRLISFNLTTRESTIVLQDQNYDIADTYLDPATEEIQAVVCEREKQEWHFLTPSVYKRIYELFSRTHPGKIDVRNSDEAHQRFIVSVERDTCPICYYLYDDTTHAITEIGKSQPNLPEKALCSVRPIALESRDGLTLHGYLALPQGKTEQVPLVLLVHGGPWQREHWGYDRITQWLTNRGYGVLTINYRGSTGYGKKFINAGNKEWGGAMQHDLVDAALWSIKKNIADPKKIAIFGGSYGGYAALTGATDTPDLFCCAASLVGISNLVSFLKSIPPYWGLYRARLYHTIGNPYTEEAFLKSCALRSTK